MTVSIGTVIYSAVKPIFKIYLIMGVGYILAKRNILNVTTCRDISDAIVTAIMPCLIFFNVVTNLKSSDIKYIGIIFFTGTLLFSAGCALAYAISVLTRSPKRWLGGLLSVGLFPNISDLPIAYMQTLSSSGAIFTAQQGSLGVAYVCIFLATQIFYQFSLGLYQLVEWDFRDELSADDEEETVKSSTDEKDEIADNTPPANSPALVADSPATGTQAIQDDDEEDDDNTSIESEKSDISAADDRPKAVHTQLDFEKAQHLAFLRQRSAMQKTQSNSRSSISSGHSSHHSLVGGSANVVKASELSLQLTHDSRHERSQDMKDVINEYSQFDELKLIRSQTAAAAAATGSDSISLHLPSQAYNQSVDDDAKSTAASVAGSTPPSKSARFKTKLLQTLKNFLAPNSVSLIVSIIIAMSPPLKALFVHAAFYIPNAPDGNAPLSFLMDFTSYVGQASVPLGLLLLGATISRLQVKKMPAGFWKTALAITIARLIILPIIGVGLTTGFYKGGWYGDDKLVRFVSVIEFGLPNATALVYFTAFYTNPNSDDHLQMDCLAICLIFQYAVLWLTLPFLVSFTLKVSLGY